jgi:hypothetical protein
LEKLPRSFYNTDADITACRSVFGIGRLSISGVKHEAIHLPAGGVTRMVKRLIIIMSCIVLALGINNSGAEGAGKIQDNSFLIEEAYNQEDGVVQHISAFQ